MPCLEPSWFHSRQPCPVLWTIFALLAFCSYLDADEAWRPLVQRVTVEGSDRTLVLETCAGKPLDRDRVARDVKRIWATGWFDDVRVVKEPLGERVVMRFELKERRRYLLRRLRIEPANIELLAQPETGSQVDRTSLEHLSRQWQERLRVSGFRDATVEFQIQPIGIRQADLLFRVKQGKRTVIEKVTVSGVESLDSRSAAGSLKRIRSRRLLPGLPGIWGGWKLRQPLAEESLDEALQQIRSECLSQGYLDCTAAVEKRSVEKGRATLSIRVQTGPVYHVQSLGIDEDSTARQLAVGSREHPLKILCDCLEKTRNRAQRNGVYEFRPEILAERIASFDEIPTQPRVSLIARVSNAPSYTVASIEFRGNHRLSDKTLRKTFLLSETEPFDRRLVRRSLGRLNMTGLVQPVSESDVQIRPGSEQHTLELVIPLRERDRSFWFAGAPDLSVFSQRAWLFIGSRLPDRMPASFELPTYVAVISLTSPLLGLQHSLFKQVPFTASVTRPYLPGQAWRSGFQFSPQASWQQSVRATVFIHLSSQLGAPQERADPLEIPVLWKRTTAHTVTPAAGILVCSHSETFSGRLRRYIYTGAELLFTGL